MQIASSLLAPGELHADALRVLAVDISNSTAGSRESAIRVFGGVDLANPDKSTHRAVMYFAIVCAERVDVAEVCARSGHLLLHLNPLVAVLAGSVAR